MTKRRLFALLLALAMAFTLAACGKKTEEPADTGSASPTTSGDTGTPSNSEAPSEKPKPDDKVLVIGVDAAFDAKWNPFLRETAYDHQVVDQIFTPVCIINKDNEVEPYAGNITYEEQSNGWVLYTITIQEGMFFTDGTPVTIDDFIYNYYVRADPSYTGPNSLAASDIEGAKEYYYGNANFSADIAAIEEECAAKYSLETISFEDFLIYAIATDLDGWWDGDPAGLIAADYTWSDYAVDEGFEADLAAIDATSADAMLELIAKIEYTNYLDDYDAEGWFTAERKSEYAKTNVGGASDVAEITGITKINDYTCTIMNTKVDIYADRGFTTHNGCGDLVPSHYYGEITKGDMSNILSNMSPMGSGPYIFQGYDNNIVTCVANEDYFLGVPRTGTVRWQVIPANDVVEALVSGQVDIANPSASLQNVDEIKANSHVRYDLIDNPGYGYMAMNCNNLSLMERKAVWSLMNRKPSIEGYYGTELAKLIERPMTTTLAEYPDSATEYYVYSREKALEYFAEAGYTQQNGKLVDASGKQFVINCFIGGQSQGAHPAYAMLVQAAEDLEALGGEIQIQDVNMNVMMAAVDGGTADMWIMAWTAVYDCDKTTQFHSKGGQNKYHYDNPQMDALLEKIPMTLDLDERSALVSQMLDLAMEDCVEYPLYQRKNMIAYNGNNVDISTIPVATTAADYQQDLWKVAVN